MVITYKTWVRNCLNIDKYRIKKSDLYFPSITTPYVNISKLLQLTELQCLHLNSPFLNELYILTFYFLCFDVFTYLNISYQQK